MARLLSSLAALAALCCASWAAPTVVAVESPGVVIVRGNKMFNVKTGEHFIMKGLTYEYAVSDTYYTKYSKAVIAKNLKDLKFNTVRVYNINPEESYKLFMDDMAALGVYVLVAASPDNSEYFGPYRYAPIRKDLPPESTSGETCYPALLLEYGKKIAKNFAQYDNTLGIILANEIMQADLTAAACVKQYAADLKTWMRSNGKMMRILPLSYAAADSAFSNPKLTKAVVQAEEYHPIKIQGLLCGDTMKDGMMLKSIDIYLINEYRWCDDVTYDQTYAKFLEIVAGAPIVMAFGEYGCHNKPYSIPRKWPMVPYMYQAPSATKGFTNVFSGGLAYSYGEAKLDLGSGFPMFTGGSLDPMSTPSNVATADYTNLKSQFAKYPSFSEPAGWTDETKCTWAPTVTESISATNTRALKSGWILDSCASSVLKVAPTDTWIAKTRQGAACDKQGAACEVVVTEPVGTTQESICGGTYNVESPGQCLSGDGVDQCSSTQKIVVASSMLSSTSVFAAGGVFLGVMLIVWQLYRAVAEKNKHNIAVEGGQKAIAESLLASAKEKPVTTALPATHTSPPQSPRVMSPPSYTALDDAKPDSRIVRSVLRSMLQFADLTDVNLFPGDHHKSFADEYKLSASFLARSNLESLCKMSEDKLLKLAIEIGDAVKRVLEDEKKDVLTFMDVEMKPSQIIERLYENLKLRVAVQRALYDSDALYSSSISPSFPGCTDTSKNAVYTLVSSEGHAGSVLGFVRGIPAWKVAEREHDWDRSKDTVLLLGIYIHGFGAWEDILNDEGLMMRQQRAMKGKLLKKQAEELLKCLPPPMADEPSIVQIASAVLKGSQKSAKTPRQ